MSEVLGEDVLLKSSRVLDLESGAVCWVRAHEQGAKHAQNEFETEVTHTYAKQRGVERPKQSARISKSKCRSLSEMILDQCNRCLKYGVKIIATRAKNNSSLIIQKR